MKRKIVSFYSFIIVLSLCVSVIPLANAALTRSSDYFAYTDVLAKATENGEFLVEFDINATDIMEEVGAKAIYIYEQQSDGKYELVETFTRYNTDGLIDTNTACAYARIYYKGTPGVKYFATVALYAKDNNGSETKYRDTNVITAPN